MIILFSLTTVFMFSFNYVYLSNVLFYPVLLKNFKEVEFNRFRIYVFCIFELFVILSTAVFIMQYKVVSTRTFIQFFFYQSIFYVYSCR